MCWTMWRRARANRSGLLFLAVGVVAAAVPRAEAAQLSVDAPESCLDPSTLADEVGDLIGKPLGSVADVDFRIQISETPQRRWRLRLEMIDQRPGGDGTPAIRGSREIEGATCAELAEAASVAIAVSVRSISPETAAPDPGRLATPEVTPPPGAKAPGSLGLPAKVGCRTLVALTCGAGFSAACSGGGGKVNIGNANVVGSQLSDYAASWDGYVEAYTFTPDGSDRVRLTIAANGQGTLEVGNQTLVAPPTDPNLGYPPGNEDPTATSTPPALWEGALYPVYGAQVQTNRIQVGIKPNDYYAAWCALQTPSAFVGETSFDAGLPGVEVSGWVPFDGGAGAADAASGTIMYLACPFPGGGVSGTTDAGTTCVGENGFNVPDFIPVDCGKSYLCGAMVCACTATGCDSSPMMAAGSAPSQYPVELDAALDSTGKTLTGTLALSTDLRVTVVLQKQ